MAGLRTRVGNEEGQTVRSRLSHLICPRRFGVEAGFGTWSPESTLGSGRLPWLHRASPSATLDKISEEDCGVAPPRQEFSSPSERRRSREIGIAIAPTISDAQGSCENRRPEAIQTKEFSFSARPVREAIVASIPTGCRPATGGRRGQCPNWLREIRRCFPGRSFDRGRSCRANRKAVAPCCLISPN